MTFMMFIDLCKVYCICDVYYPLRRLLGRFDGTITFMALGFFTVGHFAVGTRKIIQGLDNLFRIGGP